MNNRTETFLPVFPGFYSTIFDCNNEEDEINDINQQRESNGLPEISYDDCEWDYEEYCNEVSKEATNYLEGELQTILKSKIVLHFQKVHSPREYNFANDSVHIQLFMNKKTVKAIKDYLTSNKEAYTKYLEDSYTSYDGFWSSYSNDYDVWMEEYFEEIDSHPHYIGSILNFILRNEEIDDMSIYENIETRSVYATNYHELTGQNETDPVE